jgi:hypothetical protein
MTPILWAEAHACMLDLWVQWSACMVVVLVVGHDCTADVTLHKVLEIKID